MSREYTRLISVVGNVPAHGPIVLYDDFEHLLKWTKYLGEGDSVFELDPSFSFSKNQSLHIKTRTTDAAENDIIGARLLSYIPPSKRLNLSTHFSCPDYTLIKLLQFWFILFDGTNKHHSLLQLKTATPIWQYRDSIGTAIDVPDSGLLPFDNAWHRIQLLADLNTHKYIHMILDNNLFDLSALTYQHETDPKLTHLEVEIQIRNTGAAPCELHIDDFLLHEL